MGKNIKAATKYQVPHPILDVTGKILLNLTITGLLLGFGFWLALASTMGPTYLPNVMGGTLDMWIRFTMLGIGAIVWLVTPFWFLWSSVRYGYGRYQSCQAHKRHNPTDTLI